jgi:hypothetical protein
VLHLRELQRGDFVSVDLKRVKTGVLACFAPFFASVALKRVKAKFSSVFVLLLVSVAFKEVKENGKWPE